MSRGSKWQIGCRATGTQVARPNAVSQRRSSAELGHASAAAAASAARAHAPPAPPSSAHALSAHSALPTFSSWDGGSAPYAGASEAPRNAGVAPLQAAAAAGLDQGSPPQAEAAECQVPDSNNINWLSPIRLTKKSSRKRKWAAADGGSKAPAPADRNAAASEDEPAPKDASDDDDDSFDRLFVPKSDGGLYTDRGVSSEDEGESSDSSSDESVAIKQRGECTDADLTDTDEDVDGEHEDGVVVEDVAEDVAEVGVGAVAKVGATLVAVAEPESSHEPSSPQVESIKRGSIVFVQSRTWPGINKPGGVGRVTRIHPADDSNVMKYDIKVRSICLSHVVGSLGVSLSFASPVVHSRRLGEER